MNRCSVLISKCSQAPLCHTPTSWCKCCSRHNNTCVCVIHRFLYSVSPRQTRCHTGLRTPLSWMTVLYSECKKSERKCCSTFLWKNRAGLPKPSFLPEVLLRGHTITLFPPQYLFILIQHFLFISMCEGRKKRKLQQYMLLQRYVKKSLVVTLKAASTLIYGPIISCIWSQKGLFCSYLNRIVSFYIKTCFATLQKNKNKQFGASLDINSGLHQHGKLLSAVCLCL